MIMSHYEQLDATRHTVRSNPEYPCPQHILDQQVGVSVTYMMRFDGSERQGIIEVHQDLADDVIGFFKFAFDIGFPIEHVTPASEQPYFFDDNRLMYNNASSGFNHRLIADSRQLSLHALGRAIDINPRYNPCTLYDQDGNAISKQPSNGKYDTLRPDTFVTDHPLVKFMKKRSWEWGGDWTPESGRVDLHHFQKAA